jgi:UDP-glucose 4-epimerase
MTNVLLTGGAGYIGSHILEQLLDKKFRVLVVDNLITGSRKLVNKKAIFFKIDICDKKKLEKVFKYKISCIIHLAAALSVPESQKNPKKYYLNNVFGTQNILDLAAKYKVKKFIFSSTCAVYGNVKGSVKENAAKKPESIYGKTKDICEEIIISYSKNYKINCIILRYFNVIGASPTGNIGQLGSTGLFKTIAKNIISKNYKINVYGKNYKTPDGTCIRDYIDVNDLARIHILSINKNKNLILNCGYNKKYSVLEIIEKFSESINRKIKINFLKKRDGDIEKIYSNNIKLKNYFSDWKQEYDLSRSIKYTLKWEEKINDRKFK